MKNMDCIGKYITKDGDSTDTMSEQVLGVVFDGTDKELLFLPFFDVDYCHNRYHSLQEVIEIAEDFNRQHHNGHIRWSLPTLADWKAIIRNLGKTDVFEKSALDMCDRMQGWGEFDGKTAVNNLRKYRLDSKSTYWSSTEGYEEEVYLLDLGMGTVEAYPMFDDGEEDDNVLRLIGRVSKNKESEK